MRAPSIRQHSSPTRFSLVAFSLLSFQMKVLCKSFKHVSQKLFLLFPLFFSRPRSEGWPQWTAKKTNEWVLNKAGVKRELLDTVKARKLAYYGHTTRELPGERDNARNNARCTQARKTHTAWMDSIRTWSGLPVEESIRMTEDRDKRRKYVHGVANPRIEDG